MKIEVVNYNPEWPNTFDHIRKELQTILGELNPDIEHIGSTAVPDLAAKPIIDIAVGLNTVEDLDNVIRPMLQNQYIYYEVYNAAMPLRRFFLGLKDKKDRAKFKDIYSEGDTIPHEKISSHKLCHIHVWEFGSSEWIRHIAFRDYLIEHPTVKDQYATLKKQLSKENWRDGNEYNEGKDSFIKVEQSKAVLWYNKEREK